MDYPVMEADSIKSGIKRHVKDKRIPKTKLNVSLASKIKTKIINNSSIFKISLKHNNRALAQALSREKENSRRITTEKMVLQKEVEKLNFENAFLRLKLNNLNKKLIEIESLMNNNLITAIEMSSLSEFHQSSFLLPASKKKRISKQSKLMRLPFARVPLTSNDDDDDDKQKMQCDNSIMSNIPPDIPSVVSTRQPLSNTCNLEVLLQKENNQNVYGLHGSEHISSIVDILPIEIHSHSDESSKSTLLNEVRNAPSINHKRDKPSPTNVTERKKCGSSWESNNLIADTPCAKDLDQQWISSSELNLNNEVNDCASEKNITVQRNRQCLPDLSSQSSSIPNAEYMNPVQDNDDLQLQKTVYDADMDLTAGEVSKIVTVSRGNKNKSNKKPNDCEIKTFRKVKDPSSEKKRERSKRKCGKNSDVDVEERVENRPERRSVALEGKRNSESPNFSTEQLTRANILQKTTLQNDFDQDDRQNTQYNKKKKGIHITNEQEETYAFSQSSDKFSKESKFDMDQNSLTCNKNKATQAFAIHKLEKDSLFSNQKNKDTISENPEVANEFQTADLSSKNNGNLCDYETQNMLNFKKHATDMQLSQQNESKVNKVPRQKINRKTQIISKINQIYEDNDKDVHVPKNNFYPQTQVDKETVCENLGIPGECHSPALSVNENGDLRDCETQDAFGLQKQITNVYPVEQNESKINKLRQKVNRRTEIISEVNQFNNNKNVRYSEKGNSFFLRKDEEIIPGHLKDSSEFQTPALCTKDSGKLSDYETQNVLGVEKHVHDRHLAVQNDSKTDRKLRQKVHRKTEIISEINQVYEKDSKGINDLEKDNVSLTQKVKETVSEKPEVLIEFQAADFSPKDNENVCDYETQDILNLKKHVTNMQLTQQNESKMNKKPRQKVNRRTEIISEMNQIYEDNHEDVHGQKSDTKDLNFKIDKSKRLEYHGIISKYCAEINSNENENFDDTPNSNKLVSKHKKKSSSKAKNSLTRNKNKPVSQLTEFSHTSVSIESSLKHNTDETNSDPGNQFELPKDQKQSTMILNTKRDIPVVEVIQEGQCQVKKVNKMTSKSKKRKTFIDPSPESNEVMEIIADIAHRRSIDSEQANKENSLENKKIVKIKPNFYTNVFKPLSQIYSSNMQDSFGRVHESSIPLSISPSKNRVTEEKFALESSPIFPVNSDVHEKMNEVKFEVNQRTQKSEIGNMTLKNMTNTSFVSNNTAKSENESEDLFSEPPSRKRRCVPTSLKEPSLKRKMRR